MSGVIPDVLFWLLAAMALIGAGYVVFAREVMRMALGLGTFLLAVAGFFAYYGFGFLALAEVFVYVGGVLILILFAIMLLHRGEGGRPDLASRQDLLLGFAVASLAGLIGLLLQPAAARMGVVAGSAGPGALAQLLLGPMLVPFELAGALLLAALIAVVVVTGGEKR